MVPYALTVAVGPTSGRQGSARIVACVDGAGRVLGQRARIVLLAGHGLGTGGLVARIGASRPIVIQW